MYKIYVNKEQKNNIEQPMFVCSKLEEKKK